MARTDWSQVVYDKQLATAKSVHKKLFVTQKILASELPEYREVFAVYQRDLSE